MEVRLRWSGATLLVRGAHPPRPGRAWRIELRNLVLRQLAELDWTERSILAGDLNVTSTSPAFRQLVAASGLRDSRRGFGRQPTFTTRTLVPGLSIAIDHVLVGAGLHVCERWTSRVPGSDHLAVIVRLAHSP